MLLSFCAQQTFAQEKGTIDFQNISFNQALLLSAKTGKPVFIDCYTSWCAPCKQMEKTVFTKSEVYSFYNDEFINFKLDMEKGEGVDLKKRYAVNSFPTYLFVDSKGALVHRTASLMPFQNFLAEGKKAISSNSYSALKAKYEAGDRSEDLLLDFAVVLRKIDRALSENVQKELLDKITDEELHSPFGWKVIQSIAFNESDRLGKNLLTHRDYFKKIAGDKEVQTVLNRLKMATMYKYIREKDSVAFFAELNEMKKDTDPATLRNVAMLETDYYLEMNQPALFIQAAEQAANGILKINDADLSFIARRAAYKANGNKDILNESLKLARAAVVLNPEEYSNQGTLASICLELKLKEEGLIAAKKARALADLSTSKIQKLAQQLLDKIEAL